MELSVKKLIVGISGATGAIYGIKLLEVLKHLGIETHVVITDPAKRTILYETDYSLDQVKSLASYYYDINNIGAAIASGTFKVDGMVVIPCSVKTLSAIVNSYNVNLLIRAADVTLKEKRKLILVVREAPLHKGHLELMMKACDLGAIILPPMMAFYFRPKTLEDMIDHLIAKVLGLLGIEYSKFRGWGIKEGEEIERLDINDVERVDRVPQRKREAFIPKR